MDKVARYRRILRRLVREYARYQPSHGQIEPIPVCDAKSDNYLLLHAGWDNIRRVHSTVFHLRLRDGKILIEEDGLEHGITQDLIDAGVSQKDIVYSLENGKSPAFRKAS
ncbi:MAG: XisI protein [Acidobacteriota bacterium]